MALVRTTLTSAVAVDDTFIVVASATGFAANYHVRVNNEWMVVQSGYASGTTIPVRRGQQGSKGTTHVVTSGVVVGVASDWDAPGVMAKVNHPIAGRARVIKSLTATGTLAFESAGTDLTLILNGTSVIALTVPVPTVDMDGDELTIMSNGAAAHTLTFTGGLSGAGGSYDIITINATAPAALTFVACNALWLIKVGAALGGTVTNLIGSVA